MDETMFTSHLATCRYACIPFGSRKVPTTFKSPLEIILSEVRWNTLLVYIDDVDIFFNNNCQLVEEKCHFVQEKIESLGHYTCLVA